jgi:hypothetical protein
MQVPGRYRLVAALKYSLWTIGLAICFATRLWHTTSTRQHWA